jgi:hypothetical protein
MGVLEQKEEGLRKERIWKKGDRERKIGTLAKEERRKEGRTGY